MLDLVDIESNLVIQPNGPTLTAARYSNWATAFDSDFAV